MDHRDDELAVAEAEMRRLLLKEPADEQAILEMERSPLLRAITDVRPKAPEGLKGIFGLRTLQEDELLQAVRKGQALRFDDGVVYKAYGCFDPLGWMHGDARQPRTWYIRSLDDYFDLAAANSPVGMTTAYRGQVAEFGGNVTFGRLGLANAGFNRWFSLEPGSRRRKRWPGESKSNDDLLESLKIVPITSKNYHADLGDVSEQRFVQRRITDLSDPWRAIAQAIGPTHASPPGPRWILDAVLQHYGPATDSIDITRVPEVALFFATHKYVPVGADSATYAPNPDHGVIYALVLPDEENAAHRGTRWPIASPWLDLSTLFDNSDNLRPVRQAGVILRPRDPSIPEGPFEHVAATQYVRARFLIHPKVGEEARARLPHCNQDFLFPDENVDPLFAKLKNFYFTTKYVRGPMVQT